MRIITDKLRWRGRQHDRFHSLPSFHNADHNRSTDLFIIFLYQATNLEQNQNTNEQVQPDKVVPAEVQEGSQPAASETSFLATTEVKDETSTLSTQPQTANTKPAPTNQQPQTESMEVHKHPHHVMHKKKWTEYLLEFFMLFLAVFLGFIAENIREHIAETNHAKELAKNFFEEVRNDSIVASKKVANRIKQENALIDLAKYLKDSSLTKDVSKTFVLNFIYGIYFRTPSVFEPKTVILEQLKNSGSLRYFKNEELQKSIGDLSVAINNIKDRQELENQTRLQYINPIIIDHYDFDFEAELTQHRKLDIFTALTEYENDNRTVPFHLKSIEKIDKERLINILQFYAGAALTSTRKIHFQNYMELNTRVLKLLREEYHLE
jgi:hypothetical protein